MNETEFTFKRYGTFAERAKKLHDADSVERSRLLYMWTKQGVVSLKQFQDLLEIHAQQEESDRNAHQAWSD